MRRPPGRATRIISASPASGSSRCWNTRSQRTASNYDPSRAADDAGELDTDLAGAAPDVKHRRSRGDAQHGVALAAIVGQPIGEERQVVDEFVGAIAAIDI
jgi:hypothetical protein